MLKPLLKTLAQKAGYEIISTRYYKQLIAAYNHANTQSKFALHSGERQAGAGLDKIRRDHVARYEKAGDIIRSHFGPTEDLVGIDIFCGNGFGTHVVNQLTSSFIWGVDASEEAIRLANTQYANEKVFFTAKVFPFPLPHQAFDFLIAFASLEHLNDDKAFMATIAQAVKPGGLLFVSTFNERIAPLSQNKYPFHIRHYHPQEIIDFFEKNYPFKLHTWYGNSAYHFFDGIRDGVRSDSQMELKEKQEDAHVMFVFFR